MPHAVLVLVYECIPLSHPPSPIHMSACVCLLKKKKKRYSILSRRPTSVMYDIEKGFLTCSTLTAASSFGVAL